jgi:Tfp pilus assembly protein PilV
MRNNQQGFILIDSLIGMVVLTIALLALGAVFIQTTKGTLATDNLTKAAYIANEQLSMLKVNDGLQQDRNSPVWTTSKTLAAEANHGTVFTVATAVVPPAEVPADLHADTIPVRATVSWNEPTGARQLQIITYYYYGAR